MFEGNTFVSLNNQLKFVNNGILQMSLFILNLYSTIGLDDFSNKYLEKVLTVTLSISHKILIKVQL